MTFIQTYGDSRACRHAHTLTYRDHIKSDLRKNTNGKLRVEAAERRKAQVPEEQEEKAEEVLVPAADRRGPHETPDLSGEAAEEELRVSGAARARIEEARQEECQCQAVPAHSKNPLATQPIQWMCRVMT